MDLGIFIGALSLIIGIYSIVITLRQQNRRRICYQVISSVSLVSVSSEVKSKVEVKFEGRLIGDAHQVILRLWNAGDAFIRADEFTVPIKFNFSDAEVLGVPEILETEPMQLKDRVSLTYDVNTKNVTLAPLLLNSHDSITWQVSLTGFKNVINVTGVAAGVKKIERVDRVSYVIPTYRLLADVLVSMVVKWLR